MNIIFTIIFIFAIYVPIINCEQESQQSSLPNFDDILKDAYGKHRTYKRGIEETHWRAVEVIQQHNYPCEQHTVITKDGYVLTLHRIPYGKSCHRRSKRQVPRPPVLLMHGVMASTTNWITNGPLSLAYLLADNGFDVWMGNARGNPYSRVHTSRSPFTMPFWDFSFHEIGKYDLPAMIDHILDQTGFPNLHYVGHSQGSTVILILLALRPVYNDKIISAYLLSPVAYMNHMTSPFLILWSLFSNPIGLFFDIVGYGEFLPNSDAMRTIARMLCKDGDFTKFICTVPLFLITGLNPNNVLPEVIPVYVANAGSVASRQLIHYGQLYNSGQFRPFDFGIIENPVTYGSLHPPNYPLGNIRAPLFLFSAPNDWLANPIDVDRLHRELPTSIKIDIPDPTFTHLDFIIGMNAPELVYYPILWQLNNMSVPAPPVPNIPAPPNPQLPNFPDPPNPQFPDIPSPPNPDIPSPPNPEYPNIPAPPNPEFPSNPAPPNPRFPSIPAPPNPRFPSIPTPPYSRSPNPRPPRPRHPYKWIPISQRVPPEIMKPPMTRFPPIPWDPRYPYIPPYYE